MTDLLNAVAQIKYDPDLARRFSKDPEGVLKEMGVATDDLRIQKAPADTARSFAPIHEQLTVCASIGYIVCASVGGELK